MHLEEAGHCEFQESWKAQQGVLAQDSIRVFRGDCADGLEAGWVVI
jgi:hypothetical protein